MERVVNEINEKIIKHSSEDISIALENGKLGLSIYFFKLAEITGNKVYRVLAERLVNEILQTFRKDTSAFSAYELSQISFGIDYLVKNKYIQGSINEILLDFDDVIFLKSTSINGINYKSNQPLHILYYLYIRIEVQKKGSDSCIMLEELCIKIVNELLLSLGNGFYDEPLLYTIDYRFPQFLFVLGKLYSLKFYNYKLEKVLKDVSFQILSRLPLLHSNRLYLLWSLVHLKKETKLNIWDEQMAYLSRSVDCDKIVNVELRNKNVFIRNGISSIYLLLTDIDKTPYRIDFDGTMFYNKIRNSDIWSENQWLKEGLGLLNGFSGLLLVALMIDNRNNKISA